MVARSFSALVILHTKSLSSFLYVELAEDSRFLKCCLKLFTGFIEMSDPVVVLKMEKSFLPMQSFLEGLLSLVQII